MIKRPLPKDTNLRAKAIMELATQAYEDAPDEKKLEWGKKLKKTPAKKEKLK